METSHWVFFTNTGIKTDKLVTLSKIVIDKLFSVGLLPKLLSVIKQLPARVRLQKLNVTSKSPFFEVKDKNIFVFLMHRCLSRALETIYSQATSFKILKQFQSHILKNI